LPHDLGAFCVCDPGRHPVAGGLECVPNDASDPCAGVDCGGHGFCGRSPDGAPSCFCLPGWRVDESGLWCFPDEWPADGGADAADGSDADSSADASAEADATDGGPLWVDRWVYEPVPSKVDILVLVDNSGSMAQEQCALTLRFPELVIDLLDPPLDYGSDPPRPSHPPVEDLNIGVISSDMGAMGFALPSCERDPLDGDDGCFLHWPSPAVAGCHDGYPAFLSRNELNAATYSSEQMARDFTCLATLGTAGCNFEQPLAALEKALFDNAAPGGCNEGFLRPDSLLMLIVVTDEDDCSVDPAHPEMFDERREDLGHVNLRCHRFPEFVRTVEHFAASFARLAPGRLGRMVLGVIAGVPLDRSECQGPGEELEDCLDESSMQERVDPALPGQLIPSCNTSMGLAFPPRRLVQLAIEWSKSVGSSYVDSVCTDDWAGALHGITEQIVDDIRDDAVCLPTGFPFDPSTCTSPCYLIESLEGDEPCEADPSCPPAWCPPARPETLDRLEPCRNPATGDICAPLERDLGLDGATFGRRRCLIRQARRNPFLEHCGDFYTPLEAGWWVTPAAWWDGCDVIRFYRPPGSVPPFLVDPATSTATLRCWR
jgi:hypothetical protein